MKQNPITLAALSALSSGDAANFTAAITPGGIEAQEKAGQIRQSFSDTLPKQGCDKAALERLGFKFTGEGQGQDQIFWTCEFPKGWRKKPTDHSMWSDLLDAKERKRGSIFFKAAFYDYNAHMGLECRYNVKSEYLDDAKQPILGPDGRYLPGQQSKQTAFKQFSAFDSQTKESIHTAPIVSADYIATEKARNNCEAWLSEKFPDWKKSDAYWE